MNRRTFEDTIFIVNMRIRLIRDTLHLDPPPELFLKQNLDDLDFIGRVLDFLAQALDAGSERFIGNGEYDHLAACDEAADAEWQFNQILTEFSLYAAQFPASTLPEAGVKAAALQDISNVRRKTYEESGDPAQMAQAEPIVSSAELSCLLGG